MQLFESKFWAFNLIVFFPITRMPVEIGPKCDIKDQAIELNAYQLISMYKKKILSKNFEKISLILFINYKFFAVLS